MNDRSKREIKQLVRGNKDPRRVISPRSQFIIWVGFYAIAVSTLLFDLHGVYLILFTLLFVFYIAFMLQTRQKEKQLKLLAEQHSYTLCLWCRYPLAGLPNRGVCAECGKGYDLSATVALNKERYLPLDPVPLDHIIYTRRKWNWVRALRERDRYKPGATA